MTTESKQIQVYSHYSYRDYLDEWEARFGDEDTGNYGYYSRGVRIPYTVTRLSPEQFEQHVKALQSTTVDFETALAANDDEGMRRILAERFPHELALLI